MSERLISVEPATGSQLWQGTASDVAAEVARVAESWPAWASTSITSRIETMRRFANIVRAKEEALTDLIARETGKPLWDART